jgi:hypothetical protein
MKRKAKILIFQILANLLLIKLNKTKNSIKWYKTFNVAWNFNKYCISHDIYLN